jgi:hypothetical protein
MFDQTVPVLVFSDDITVSFLFTMVRIIVYNKRGVVVVAVVFLLIAGAEKNCRRTGGAFRVWERKTLPLISPLPLLH